MNNKYKPTILKFYPSGGKEPDHKNHGYYDPMLTKDSVIDNNFKLYYNHLINKNDIQKPSNYKKDF